MKDTHEDVPISTRLTVLVGGVALVQPVYVVPDGGAGQGDCPFSVSSALRVPIDDWLQAVWLTSPDGHATVPVFVYWYCIVPVAAAAVFEQETEPLTGH